MDKKDTNRGFSGLTGLTSDSENSLEPQDTSEAPASKPLSTEKAVFPLIALSKWPTAPATWSSVDRGETWVWGDFYLTFQKKPKSVLNLTVEMRGKEPEYHGMTYHYAMCAFYRFDRNPHGPSMRPIKIVALEQADKSILAEMLGDDVGDLLKSEGDSKMGPLMLGLFTAKVHLNFGEYEDDMDPQTVKRHFFGILGPQLGVAGEPKLIGDLAQAHGHPETGLPAKKIEPPSTRPTPTPTASGETGQEDSVPRQSIERVGPGKKSKSSGGKWIFVIIAGILAIWFFSNSGQNTKKAPQSQNLPQQSSSPVTTLNSDKTNGLQYDKPPVGRNNVLSVPQLRWCVREGIRIEAMRDYIESNVAVDEFNRGVDDYNRRCASFRYQQGSLEPAQREVEANRNQIVAEAIRNAGKLGRNY